MSDEPQPKPRVEVTQEPHETLEVLDLDRVPREEKLRRETALLRDAHEVRYRERGWRPRHATDLDAVRRAVDALEPARRELPDVPAAPSLPPEPEPAAPAVSDEHRALLAPHVSGELVRVDVVHRAGGGVVVDAAWRADGGTASGLFLLKDGTARAVEDVAALVDSLPEPAAAPEEPAEAAPEPAPEEPAAKEAPTKEERKGLRARLGRKDASKDEEKKAETPEEKPKKRFGLGRKKDD